MSRRTLKVGRRASGLDLRLKALEKRRVLADAGEVGLLAICTADGLKSWPFGTSWELGQILSQSWDCREGNGEGRSLELHFVSN